MITPNLKRADRVNIMPMGDSITEGFGSPTTAGYRAKLFETMTSRLGTNRNLSFVGANGTNFISQKMCGTAGLTTGDISVAPYASVQVTQYVPDVILLHIGTNDCTQLHTGGIPTLATSLANYTTILNSIRTQSPRVIVFAALIIDNNTAHTEVVNYNTAINSLIQARSDYSSGFVKIVDMYTAMGPYSATYYFDGTHPNQDGYNAIIAPTWQTALNTIF